MTDMSAGSAERRPQLRLIEPGRCAGFTVKGTPCKRRVRNGSFCVHHQVPAYDRWNREITAELNRRHLNRHPFHPNAMRQIGPSTLELHPPQLPPPPEASRNAVNWNSVADMLAALLSLCVSGLVFIVDRFITWVFFGLLAFFPMLAAGAIGIFVMVFIGAGVAMLKMAAY